jgi:hypothetical protein
VIGVVRVKQLHRLENFTKASPSGEVSTPLPSKRVLRTSRRVRRPS